MEEKKVYVIRPNTDCYYGYTVDKNTKLEFENEMVKQKVENLILYSETHYKTEDFESETKLKVNLKEGDILLLEEDGRGLFLPKDSKIGSIDEAIGDLNFLKEQISKIKE
jgi:hypothetical protein